MVERLQPTTKPWLLMSSAAVLPPSDPRGVVGSPGAWTKEVTGSRLPLFGRTTPAAVPPSFTAAQRRALGKAADPADHVGRTVIAEPLADEHAGRAEDAHRVDPLTDHQAGAVDVERQADESVREGRAQPVDGDVCGRSGCQVVPHGERQAGESGILSMTHDQAVVVDSAGCVDGQRAGGSSRRVVYEGGPLNLWEGVGMTSIADDRAHLVDAGGVGASQWRAAVRRRSSHA